jgi:hypothetical protein
MCFICCHPAPAPPPPCCPPAPTRYTCHVEANIRSCAQDTLQAVLQGSPHLRPHLLASLAATLAAVPEDAVGSLRELMAQLRSMMEGWQQQLVLQQVGACRCCVSVGLRDVARCCEPACQA